LYIFLAVAAVTAVILLLRKKEQRKRDKTLKILSGIPFGLYMADFFLMPFAYGEIDVDKLPFHACTAMGIMCFLSNRHSRLLKYRWHFALLGLFAGLSYLAYPAGVMAYEITPLSYRVIQTMLFHGAMVVYTVLALVLDENRPKLKYCYRDLVILGIMTAWAWLGNTLYSGAADGYDRDFNWFFVKADPFGLFSPEIAPYVMPALNIVAFFAVDILIYLAFAAVEKAGKRRGCSSC
jgi:hypothetical protein